MEKMRVIAAPCEKKREKKNYECPRTGYGVPAIW